MKQVSLGLNLSTKKTRKREFLEQMNKVVPWDVLVGVVEPHWPKSKTGRPPFAIETMLRMGCCRFRGHQPKLLELSRTVSD